MFTCVLLLTKLLARRTNKHIPVSEGERYETVERGEGGEGERRIKEEIENEYHPYS